MRIGKMDLWSFPHSMSKKIKVRLQSAQNKTVRYILNYHCRQHLGFSDFSKLGWLNVCGRVDYVSLNLMYNIFSKTAPSYMCNEIQHSSHSYGTRQRTSSIVIPHVKTQGSKTFKYCTIKLWNSLPLGIKSSRSKEEFKRNCKKYLMDRMKENELCDFTV